MFLQYLKKGVRHEVDLLHADKHQSFLQVHFNTWNIKVSLLIAMIKHSQSNKLALALQCLANEVSHKAL